jgi:hypothetical protein
MRKMFFFVLAAAVLLIMVPAQNAQAQSHSETPKVEFGVQYTFLRLRDFDTNTSGVGGRATYNVTDNFGIESEVNFFPQRLTNFATLLSTGSQRTQALFGVKYGMRSEKLGIFGKLRPGFMHFSEGTSVPGVSSSATEFALDYGGVLELYPSRHVALRFDVGDTVIRFGNLGITSHNLQITPGVAFRF